SLIAKPDLISWLEEEEELFLLTSEEEEGLAVGETQESLNKMEERQVKEKEDSYAESSLSGIPTSVSGAREDDTGVLSPTPFSSLEIQQGKEYPELENLERMEMEGGCWVLSEMLKAEIIPSKNDLGPDLDGSGWPDLIRNYTGCVLLRIWAGDCQA
ncbi:UNVERIFIED_CONTAM: hypothetical protein K2H54_063413, partial [Gekko kuhli]